MKLCELFTNFYDNVSFQTIAGRVRPCYFDGTDMIPIEPTDVLCEFAYTRQIGETIATPLDFGGCDFTYNYKDRKIFVYFCKGLKSKDKIIKKFKQAENKGVITIESINSNVTEMYKKEVGVDKILEFKEVTYIGVTYIEEYLEKNKCNECDE